MSKVSVIIAASLHWVVYIIIPAKNGTSRGRPVRPLRPTSHFSRIGTSRGRPIRPTSLTSHLGRPGTSLGRPIFCWGPIGVNLRYGHWSNKSVNCLPFFSTHAHVVSSRFLAPRKSLSREWLMSLMRKRKEIDNVIKGSLFQAFAQYTASIIMEMKQSLVKTFFVCCSAEFLK